MPRVESTMLPLGTTAPHFSLPDVTSGSAVSLETLAGRRALLVVFLGPHCPFVQHVQAEVAHIGHDYGPLQVGIVAISANDPAQNPGDGPDGLRDFAKNAGLPFPLLFDETQQTARDYAAACTPDFFLFDGHLRLAYRGQLDGSRPGNDIPVTGSDLRSALDAVLAGRPVAGEQRASLGCNVKWKPGNEPAYFTKI